MQRNATLAAGENVFKVYNSNHVDVLQALLVELIQREPLQNPFEQEHILVQSPGRSVSSTWARSEHPCVSMQLKMKQMVIAAGCHCAC